MGDDRLTDEDWEGALPQLGPAYDFSRRVVEKAFSGFNEDHLQSITKAAADDFYDKLQDHICDYFWSDVEMNLQYKMWNAVNDIVDGILGGRKYVFEHYALGERYRCEDIRKALVEQIPREVQDARIADLVAEVEKLTDELQWYRDRG